MARRRRPPEPVIDDVAGAELRVRWLARAVDLRAPRAGDLHADRDARQVDALLAELEAAGAPWPERERELRALLTDLHLIEHCERVLARVPLTNPHRRTP